MPIDPNIPLQAKAPDSQNMLTTLLGVQQFKNQQQVGNRLMLDTNSSQAVGKAIQRNTGADGNVNYAGVQSDLAKDPNATYGLQAATGTNQTQRGQQILNDSNQLKLSSDQYAHAVQNYGTLLNKPNLSYGDVVDAVNQAGKLYGLPNDVIKNSIATVPTDETQLKPFIQSRLAGLQAPGSQLSSMTPKPVLTSDGATYKYRDENPISNPDIVGDQFDAKLTPGQASQRVPMVAPDGRPGSIPFSDTVPQGVLPPAWQQPGQQGGGQPPAAPGRYPQGVGGANGIQQPAQPQQPRPYQGGFIPSGQAPGIAESKTAAATGSGQEMLADQKSNGDSGTRISILQSADAALKGATSGQGSQGLQNLRGALVTWGLASQAQADKVQSYDEANKYLTQYAQRKASSFGNSTDAQLSAAITGNGSTHISNLAAQDVVKVNLGLERMEQARMQEWTKTGLAPDQYSKWKSQFGATLDPRVFIADEMDPKNLKAMFNRMNPKEMKTFQAQYRWAANNGYLNGGQ